MMPGPGIVVIEPLVVAEAKTAGGLFIPQTNDRKYQKTARARIVAASDVFQTRTGELHTSGPITPFLRRLIPGAIIEHENHNPWESADGRLHIRSYDIVQVCDQE